MKKILISLVMLCTTAAKVTAVDVATAEALRAAVEADNGADIVLTADIDISTLGKLCETFTGSIQGAYAIVGGTTPLFDKVEGATFRNVTFKDCNVQTLENFSVGAIACEASGSCKFENVCIQNSIVTRTLTESEHLCANEIYVGGLVGSSDGSTFVGCSIDDQTGVYSKVDFLEILANIFAGGLVGYSKNDTYESCVNKGLISSFSYVGGLAGWAEKAQINSCINAGTSFCRSDEYETIFAKYKTKSYNPSTMEYDGQTYSLQAFTMDDIPEVYNGVLHSVGGLFGYIGDGSVMTNCVNLSFHAMGYPIGGLVGGGENSTIDRCCNYGSSKMDGWGKHHRKGGIIGRTVGVTVSNCLNTGTFEFAPQYYSYGSIVGVPDANCKVFNCFSMTASPIAAYSSVDRWDLDGNTSNNNFYLKSDAEYTDMDWERGVTEVLLASGRITYLLNGRTNDKSARVWQQNLGTDKGPVLGNKGIYHSRNVTSTYGTVCLPYSLYSNDDIKYYEFSNETTCEGEVKLHFKYTETVDCGTPVVFSSTIGEHSFLDMQDYSRYPDLDFNLSEEAGNGDWKMHSHPFEKVFEGDEAKTVYYVSDNMIRNAKKTTIAPFRAYFRGQSIDELTAAGAKAIRFVIEDEDGTTTALELVGEDLVLVQNGKTYSVMGTEVGGSYRGIVIRNGKKVLIK